jgi:hypothetical protein
MKLGPKFIIFPFIMLISFVFLFRTVPKCEWFPFSYEKAEA